MPKNRLSSLFLLSTMLLAECLYSLSAETHRLSFQRISLPQGLSQSIVQCITQDDYGFLWFGTEDGLNRYDGYSLKILKNDPNDDNSLSYNNITALAVDTANVMWIGTFNGGLNRFDLRTGKITRHVHRPEDPTSLSNNVVRAIYCDNSGAVWIGTDNGLNKVTLTGPGQTVSFVRFVHQERNPASLSHNTVRAICQDHLGRLWIGTDGGLNRMVPNGRDDESVTFSRQRHDPNRATSLANDVVRALYRDRQDRLWVGTDGGLDKMVFRDSGGTEQIEFVHHRHESHNSKSLSHPQVYAIRQDRFGILWIGTNGGGLNRFDAQKNVFCAFINDPNDPTSLSYNEIHSLYEDHSGVLWIGTYGGGVCAIDNARKNFSLYRPDPNDPNGLNQGIVWCIHEDSAGFLWIGTHGGGLNRLDRKTQEYTHYLADPNNPNSLSSNIVRLILEDDLGNFWIGTHGGGVCYFDRKKNRFTQYRHDIHNPNSLSHNDIRTMYRQVDGDLWIGTRGGGLDKMSFTAPNLPPTFEHFRHDPQDPNSISSDMIRVIYRDKAGRFWIATEGGGLNKLDPATRSFTRYRANSEPSIGLNNDYIFAIHEDVDGSLWLGTWGGGLNHFNPEDGTGEHFTQEDGLPSNSIYAILPDDRGNLWLSTNNGLSQFDPVKKTFRNFDVRDGLQSNEFNGGSFFKSASGELFFGGINGFNAFFPDSIRDNPHIPPIVITAFQKFNKEIELTTPIWELQDLTLSHKDYVFSFEFSALDFTAPEKNRYAYRMKGLDKEWIYTTPEKRFATYTTLSPGRYVFLVKGSNNDGVWNEKGTQLRITITPPFWRTWWFICMLILFAFWMGYLWYQRRLRTVRLKIELRAAHDAQMFIMPQSDPEIPNLQISGITIPANEVGGDFFDYVWLDENKTRFGVFVGDVSGKAMKAAMTAVMTSGMLQTEAREASSVAEILTRVNTPLYFKTNRNVFTVVCFTSIDLNTLEFVFANAGLVEPLLKSGGQITYLKMSGTIYPLGSFKDNHYQERKVQLKSGDIVLLLSDGITEAQNGDAELYGEERLNAALQHINTTMLSAKEIKQAVIEDVMRFVGSSSQHDDMTLVVIKVLPAASA